MSMHTGLLVHAIKVISQIHRFSCESVFLGAAGRHEFARSILCLTSRIF